MRKKIKLHVYKWHEENPEDEDEDSASSRSRSPEAHERDLSSLVYRGPDSDHGSRGHSREPSEGPSGGYARAPSRARERETSRARSRARSRDRRECEDSGRKAKMSNVCDLLLQMKMMHSV